MYMKCETGKVQYKSQEDAKRIFKQLRNRHRTDGTWAPRRVYLCNHCNAYHITSKVKVKNAKTKPDTVVNFAALPPVDKHLQQEADYWLRKKQWSNGC